VDCDAVQQFITPGGQRTLTSDEEAELERHIAGCATCRTLVSSGATPTRPPTTIPAGTKIGRFEVLEHLGSGGMGTVVAARDPHLDRRVAIKLVRTRAFAGGEVVAREQLIREARAMARLSHENVLTVHEVDTVDDQVFIAMELAAGGSLKAWLQAEPRSWREVLDRFIKAGRGLVAAHAAGLIHRDFKPDNVLLTHDGAVRVADFGLVGVRAAAVDASTTDAGGNGQETLTGKLVGTPAYMAPEQIRGDKVDARADQYAFCASLYEALHGHLPFAADSIGALVLGLEGRQLRPPPADTPVPAWVHGPVVRGLSTDPEARHPSMRALIAALEADPAAARRRRRTAIVVGASFALVVAALVIVALRSGEATDPCARAADGLAGVWNPSRRTEVERAFVASKRGYAGETHARVAQRVDAYAGAWGAARVDACEATHARGAQSDALLDRRMACLDRRGAELGALIDVFIRVPSGDVLDRAVQATDDLIPIAVCSDRAVLEAAVPLPEDPAVRAKVVAARARLDEVAALERAGQYGEALARAGSLADDAAAVGHPPLAADARALVARLLEATGKFADAEAAFRAVLSLSARAGDDALVAETWRHLIDIVGVRQARHADALALEPAAETAVIRAGDPPRLRAALWHSLAGLAGARSDHDAATRGYEQALALRERELGPAHLSVADTLSGLGVVFRAQGNYDRARAVYERALGIYRDHLGPAHPEVARTLSNLGVALNAQGMHAEAQRELERALAINEAALGPDHPRVASALNNLGLTFKAQGKYAEARERYERALAIYEAVHGTNHPQVSSTLNNLAFVLHKQGELAAAQAHYERALAIDLATLGADHPFVANTLHNLGLLLEAQHDLPAAQARFEESLAIKERALGPEHASLANTLTSLASVRKARGDRRGAREDYQRALAIGEQALGPEHASLAFALIGLAELLVTERRIADAVPLLERALAVRDNGDEAAELVAESRFALGRVLWQTGRDRARAVELVEQARAGFATSEARTGKLAEVDRWLSTR
jgi:tetratricopeptide (TPR) repeat protein